MFELSQDDRRTIETRLMERFKVHGLDYMNKRQCETKKALTMQADFLAGALTMLNALHPDADRLVGPPAWTIAIMSGRSIFHF